MLFRSTFVDAWQTPIEDIGPSGQDKGSHAISIGFDYESSPVDDKDRTFDLPFDEIYKVSLAYGWKGNKRLDFSLGSTVYISGDAKIDQTSQGVRAKGKFDTNYVVFLGGTARYRF